jgi:hypothetical protein
MAKGFPLVPHSVGGHRTRLLSALHRRWQHSSCCPPSAWPHERRHESLAHRLCTRGAHTLAFRSLPSTPWQRAKSLGQETISCHHWYANVAPFAEQGTKFCGSWDCQKDCSTRCGPMPDGCPHAQAMPHHSYIRIRSSSAGVNRSSPAACLELSFQRHQSRRRVQHLGRRKDLGPPPQSPQSAIHASLGCLSTESNRSITSYGS